jgi:hypothetical protein
MASDDAGPDTLNHANLTTWPWRSSDWWLERRETGKATYGSADPQKPVILHRGSKVYPFVATHPSSEVSQFDGIIASYGRTVGIDTSYLNLGRLPLLAFLCRCPLRRMLSGAIARMNQKEICTRRAKAIYIASAFFHGHGRAC